MAEKVELVDRMVKFFGEVIETIGDEVRVTNVTMFPHFVKTCCREHMMDEDVWLLDGLHRDVSREMKDGLVEEGISVPDRRAGIFPRSSLLGAGQLEFWEFGEGGTVG